MPVSFFDSNVLLYLASNDATKADRAEVLVRAGGTISVQVLNEVANVGRRKLRLPWSDVYILLGTLRRVLHVVPVTIETHEKGVALAERYMLSTYDAMIVAAALFVGCDRLWSEDMQDGFVVEGTLRIVNPFGPSA